MSSVINVGIGPDVSYVVIEESTLAARPLLFAYHYTFDTNNLVSGYGMLSAIAASNPSFGFATIGCGACIQGKQS